MKYIFAFKIGNTECEKNQIDLTNCSIVSVNKKLLVCEGSIVDKIWTLERYSDVSFKCKNE